MDLASTPLRVNVELKARLKRPDAALATALRLGAADHGEETQSDTYFSLGRERLKLRESSSGSHWLIRYARADATDARRSQYRLLPVRDAASFRGILAKQWGVKAVVRKRRHLLVWNGRVRIHLDRVEGIGDFLEFEAVLDPEQAPGYDEDAARLDVARLAHDFGVSEPDLVATSYANLVLASHGVPAGT